MHTVLTILAFALCWFIAAAVVGVIVGKFIAFRGDRS